MHQEIRLFNKAHLPLFTNSGKSYRQQIWTWLLLFIFAFTWLLGPLYYAPISYSMNKAPYLRKDSLIIMTYNIRHAKGLDGKVDLHRILRDIQKSGADVIGLQEVDRYVYRSSFQDQISELAAQLKMNAVFMPTINGGYLGQYGIAILSRYPIVNSHKVSLPTEGEPRGMLTAAMIVEGRKIEVTNLHLGLSKKERDEQVSFIINRLSSEKAASIVLGDFNMSSNARQMRGIETAYNEWRLTNPGRTVIGGRQIDHIFTNLKVRPESVYTLKSDASDHLPVVAKIHLNSLRGQFGQEGK